MSDHCSSIVRPCCEVFFRENAERFLILLSAYSSRMICREDDQWATLSSSVLSLSAHQHCHHR